MNREVGVLVGRALKPMPESLLLQFTVPGMERFVQLVAGGGIALVVGLWIVSVFETRSGPWILGGILVALGGVLSSLEQGRRSRR